METISLRTYVYVENFSKGAYNHEIGRPCLIFLTKYEVSLMDYSNSTRGRRFVRKLWKDRAGGSWVSIGKIFYRLEKDPRMIELWSIGKRSTYGIPEEPKGGYNATDSKNDL